MFIQDEVTEEKELAKKRYAESFRDARLHYEITYDQDRRFKNP